MPYLTDAHPVDVPAGGLDSADVLCSGAAG